MLDLSPEVCPFSYHLTSWSFSGLVVGHTEAYVVLEVVDKNKDILPYLHKVDIGSTYQTGVDRVRRLCHSRGSVRVAHGLIVVNPCLSAVGVLP